MTVTSKLKLKVSDRVVFIIFVTTPVLTELQTIRTPLSPVSDTSCSTRRRRAPVHISRALVVWGRQFPRMAYKRVSLLTPKGPVTPVQLETTSL
jgi:hypothetical protein